MSFVHPTHWIYLRSTIFASHYVTLDYFHILISPAIICVGKNIVNVLRSWSRFEVLCHLWYLYAEYGMNSERLWAWIVLWRLQVCNHFYFWVVFFSENTNLLLSAYSEQKSYNPMIIATQSMIQKIAYLLNNSAYPPNERSTMMRF